jgi:branched-chain amino acid aminotransferase
MTVVGQSNAYRQVFHGREWVDHQAAVVPVASLAMRYAVSVFEGVRLYRQHTGSSVQPFLLEPHLRRLRNSLDLVRLADPGVTAIPGLVDELIDRNGIDDDAYMRIAVSAGSPGDLGDRAEPLLTVAAVPMGRKRWLATGEGMHLKVSAWQRAAEASFPSAAKCISSYTGPRLALLDARAAGYDGCVLTNAAGRLCEAPTAALFLVRGGVLRTPPLSEGVLPSITRQWVLDTVRQLGIPADQAPLDCTDAYDADEAFLCGTGLEFAAVRGFDAHPCRGWPETPMMRMLVERYFQDVRGLPGGGIAPQVSAGEART